MSMWRDASGGRIVLAVLLVLWVLAGQSGCASGPSPNPDRIYGDPVVDSWVARWTAAGEPELGSPDGTQHHVRGKASWYGPGLDGNDTANGEVFDMYALTAAHKTLPFGTIVRVRAPKKGTSVVVRINDRGPYVDGRIIDLSWGAAHDLGMVRSGVVEVELDVVAWGSGRRFHQTRPK